MSHINKAISQPEKSPLPLILAGAGLILIAIALVVFAPDEPLPAKAGVESGPAPGEVSYPAPELKLVEINGAAVSLAGLRGQVVLVNNWATWCPPCRAEMPSLEAYFRAHKDDGFTLVAINSGDQRDQVVDFQREFDLTFPLWLDPTGLALREFKNNALPSSYVIDQAGTVRLFWMGAVSLEALETFVTPLLGSN
jgi:cytochrome c biogenesis protein CcmG/thiol:disulfide interchange protein DsbE